MARQNSLDVTNLTLTGPGADGVIGTGGDDVEYDLLADTMRATLTLDNVLVDVAGATSLNAVNEGQAAGATLEIVTKSSATNAVKAQDLTVFTIGGTTYLADLRSFTLNQQCTHDEGKGAASKWLEPVVTGVDYTGSVELLLDNAATNALQVLGFGTDAATALDVALAFTLNTVAFSFPMALRSSQWSMDRKQLQRLNVEFSGNGAESVNTGTATLLAAAINDPRVALFAELTTSAANGRSWEGTFVHDSVSVSIQDQNIVETTFRLRSQGAVALA